MKEKQNGSQSYGERLLIVADDFTGACDAAGAFGGSRATRVIWQASDVWPPGAEVLALDLDQRARHLDEAYAAVRAAITALPRCRVYVKIDSTLRGPIAGLIRGALEATGSQITVIAPAFPEQGRVLRHGRLLRQGQDAPEGPGLGELLGLEGTALVGSPVTHTAHELERAIDVAHSRGARQVVVDIEDGEGLAVLADVSQRHHEWLLVGSAGLARRLAPAAPTPRVTQRREPLLVVAGTPAAATHAQLQRLSGVPNVTVLRTEPADERDQGEAANTLADGVSRFADTNTPAAVVLTGGATARAVCDRLGATAIRIEGEISPGIPIGLLEGGRWHGVTVVTKAGGFGGADTLLDVARTLGVSSSQ